LRVLQFPRAVLPVLQRGTRGVLRAHPPIVVGHQDPPEELLVLPALADGQPWRIPRHSRLGDRRGPVHGDAHGLGTALPHLRLQLHVHRIGLRAEAEGPVHRHAVGRRAAEAEHPARLLSRQLEPACLRPQRDHLRRTPGPGDAHRERPQRSCHYDRLIPPVSKGPAQHRSIRAERHAI
jgi:hypothetical protein